MSGINFPRKERKSVTEQVAPQTTYNPLAKTNRNPVEEVKTKEVKVVSTKAKAKNNKAYKDPEHSSIRMRRIVKDKFEIVRKVRGFRNQDEAMESAVDFYIESLDEEERNMFDVLFKFEGY